METIIPGSDLDQFGNNSEPFFSFSQFDLDLQQQAQAAIQQQQQQQEQLQQPQRSVQNSWQDYDRYLPIDCQSFVMAEPATSNMASTSTLSDINVYSALNNDISKLGIEPATETMPSNDFATTAITSTIHTPNIVKQEYPSPGQHSDTSSPILHAHLMPSISSTLQQNTNSNSTTGAAPTPTYIPASQSFLPLNATPDVAEIIAGINWNLPVLPQSDSSKVPIHRLKPATEIQTSPSSSTDLSGGVGKQKKTAHNAIERRYRNNINDRITELKNAVPALLHAKLKEKGGRTTAPSNKRMLDDDEDDIGDDGEEYLDGVAVATKLNKATILHKATEYIHHLKRTNNDRKLENDALQHLLAQLPGGQQVLAHYRVQKVQREQLMQQQLMMERQWMKQDQQNRKKAAGKRKRANRRYNNNDDFDNGSTSSDHPHTPPSDSETGLNNRVFMALFMAIAFFSSSPLTTTAGSEQVNNHNHVSRTASEQLVISASTPNTTNAFNSHQYASNHNATWMDGWSILRLIVFIGFLIQLLSPYIKTWVFGHSFKIRRIRSATKPSRRLRNSQLTDNTSKSLNANKNNGTDLSPVSLGDEKCIRMTQLLVRSISLDHNDTTVLPRHKFGLLSSLTKEVVLFVARHVFGYSITACIADDLDNDDAWEEHAQYSMSRWKHAFKWVKLNECECLGGHPLLSRVGLLYHSIRMLNLVDALQEDELENDEQQQQLLSMRARAYATAALLVSLKMPTAYLANWMADHLWGIALNDANEEDVWAHLTEVDDADEQTNNTMATLATNVAWMETLDVIRNQLPTARPSKNATDLSLSAYAPTLVPTTILSNLHLLNQLEADFQTLIDTMMTAATDKHTNISASSVFTVHPPSMEHDSHRVAHWFTCIGATVEALWQGDVAQAEKGMLVLARQVPRAMTVPLQRHALKKKERQCELDAMVKQQVVHMLAGATLVLQKQGASGIQELETGERFRQLRTKRATVVASINELEATHVEGRVMALAEFAVMLVALKAWISTWQLDDNDTVSNRMLVDETNSRVRLVSLSLRRMVCRPALAGRLRTQQTIIDRLDKLGRYVEASSHHGHSDSGSPNDSVYSGSDLECNDDGDCLAADGNKAHHDAIKQGKVANHIHKMLGIIQGD